MSPSPRRTPGRCTGVSYVRGGVPAQVTAAREVILAAGAIGSPHLLLLSGIGPARSLRDLGIEVVADVPGAGANLQDHPMVMVSCAARSPLPPSRYNHGEMYAALRSGLAPADPDVAPRVDPGFLTDPRDAGRLEAGLRLVREAAAGSALSPLLAAEVHPGPDVSTRAGLRSYLRRAVGSYFHPAGTCRMGTRGLAAVDPRLRVHHVTGLRVADASVMPAIPNAPLNATVLALAERAASLIAGG